MMKLKFGVAFVILLLNLLFSDAFARVLIVNEVTLEEGYLRMKVTVEAPSLENIYYLSSHIVRKGFFSESKEGLKVKDIYCGRCKVIGVVPLPTETIFKIQPFNKSFTLKLIVEGCEVDRKLYRTVYLPIFKDENSYYILKLRTDEVPYYFDPPPKKENEYFVWEDPDSVMIEFSSLPFSLPFRVVYLPLIIAFIIIGSKLVYTYAIPRKSAIIQYATLNDYTFTANEGVIAMATIENTGNTRFLAKAIIELYNPDGSHIFSKVFEKELKKGETFNISHRFTILPNWQKGVYKLKFLLYEKEKLYDEKIHEFTVK